MSDEHQAAPTVTGSISAYANWAPPPNPYGRISDIAARLGVKPHANDAPATVVMPGRDGQMYDVFEVIERFLDRLDADR